jgi:PAS domain S-box-containing protein
VTRSIGHQEGSARPTTAAKGADRVDRERAMLEMRGRVLFDDAPSGCAIVSEVGEIVLVNTRLCELFGYSTEELLGREVDFLVPDRRREAHQQHRLGYDAAPRVGTMGQGRVVTGRRRDGSEFPVDVRLAPSVLDGERYVVAFVDDVTDRVRAQAELDSTRTLLQAILDHAPSQIYVKDVEGRYVLANRQVAVESGVANEAMIGRTDEEIFPGADFRSWRATEQEVIATASPLEREEGFDGHETRQTYLSQKFPLLDPDGVPYAVGGISTNITARRSLQDALESARREADRANRAKSQFLSRVSHELRTPLNSVMGFAQLLQMDADDPHVRESADQILRAGRHLLELINEVLDISRIEAGELRLSVEPVRVADVLAEVGDLIRVQADQRGLRFEPALVRDEVVFADRHRVVQVLLNLGSNAVKFNRVDGRVSMAVERRREQVRIVVRDDGPGIGPESQERLFSPFERLGVDPALEGTGLGLALSRGLTEAMGGTMGVDSTLGRGSAFWVELPAAPAADGTQSASR